MITITSAQLDVWLGLFIFPLTRILGMLATAPVFNNGALPATARLITGLAVSLGLTAALPPLPPIALGSWIGLAVLGEQLLIGVLLGFTLRIVFAAVDMAGELIGLQMGLSFAMFFDPENGGQSPVITEFLNIFTALLYLAMNGHLMTLNALSESFVLLPIGVGNVHASALGVFLHWSSALFSVGLLLSLPLIAALLIANIALGVLSRVAQQLNLFAIGFPVTLGVGFLVLMISLPYMGSAMEGLFNQSFRALENVLLSKPR